MALTQQQRNAIYDGLVPLVGEEPTEAMLAHFPARDADPPVTRDHLDVRLAELRTELAELRTELKDDIASLEARLTYRMATLIISAIGLTFLVVRFALPA